ncbi:MAG: response regulator [Bacteroidales bacterium]|nr:response regulator [Bacteroidales bacterium]
MIPNPIYKNINWDKLITSLHKFEGIRELSIILYFIEDNQFIELRTSLFPRKKEILNQYNLRNFIRKIDFTILGKEYYHSKSDLLFHTNNYYFNEELKVGIAYGKQLSKANPKKKAINTSESCNCLLMAQELISFFLDDQLKTSLSFIKKDQTNITIPIADELNEEITLPIDFNIYKMGFENATSAMAIVKINGEIVICNSAWATMHGFSSAEELTSRNLEIFHSTEQLENDVQPFIQQTIETGFAKQEVGHIDNKGKIIHTIMTATKLQDAQNNTMGILGIATEMGDIIGLQERLLTILESVSFGILIIDPENYQIIELNTAAIKYIGLAKGQIVGQECTEFVCPASKGNCPVKDLKEKVHNSERILINNKGEQIPILKTVSEVMLGDKKVFIESFTDIRELKTAQLQAEENSRLKAAFLSNISHEIRTPLNHILGFTGIILDDADISTTYKDYLKIVNKSGLNLLKIIEDIVTLSKIEAGHSAISNNEFHLNMLLYSIFTKYQSDLVRKNSTIKIFVDSSLSNEKSFILADELKIRQIIEHLICNAIKFTTKGFISMSYKLENSLIKISIKDTGIGIAKEKTKIIFDNFQKVQNKDNQQYGGTGLGLSICKSLSLLIGGDIWVDSEEGVGSTFHFSFPYQAADQENAEVKTNISTPDLHDKTILIVEDERINYLYIQTLIKKTQAKIVWKQNGQEALQYITDHKTVDLILMDMQMPVMDGYEATEKIRAINKEVIIIAQTANALADDREKCLSLGCNEYTTKPLQQDIVFWHLQHFLKAK